MSTHSRSDSELFALLQESDPTAFRELYERYWYGLCTKAARKTGRKDIAEEMAQQVFAILWQKRRVLRIDNLAAYLHISLKNLIIDYIRKNIQEENYLQHLKTFFPQSYFATAVQEVQYHELTETLHRVLGQLPEKTQQVFILSRFEQLTIPEIARALALSEKTIEYHLSRALSFLRLHLREFIAIYLLLRV